VSRTAPGYPTIWVVGLLGLSKAPTQSFARQIGRGIKPSCCDRLMRSCPDARATGGQLRNDFQVLALLQAGSMEPRWYAVVDSLDQPRYGVIGCCKHHVVLQHMVEVDKPPTMVIEDSN
jgi:hypothetical protein